jgi:hypothetical protein
MTVYCCAYINSHSNDCLHMLHSVNKHVYCLILFQFHHFQFLCRLLCCCFIVLFVCWSIVSCSFTCRHLNIFNSTRRNCSNNSDADVTAAAVDAQVYFLCDSQVKLVFCISKIHFNHCNSFSSFLAGMLMSYVEENKRYIQQFNLKSQDNTQKSTKECKQLHLKRKRMKQQHKSRHKN